MLQFKIPETFLRRLCEPIGWQELRFAYSNNLIDSRTLIEIACQQLSKAESTDEDLIRLASARPDEELKDSLERLANSEKLTTGASIEAKLDHKWGTILAAFIAESQLDDKLLAIDDVYSTFDYPEELAEFVRYMPMVGEDLGSKTANENRMVQKLKEFATTIVHES